MSAAAAQSRADFAAPVLSAAGSPQPPLAPARVPARHPSPPVKVTDLVDDGTAFRLCRMVRAAAVSHALAYTPAHTRQSVTLAAPTPPLIYLPRVLPLTTTLVTPPVPALALRHGAVVGA